MRILSHFSTATEKMYDMTTDFKEQTYYVGYSKVLFSNFNRGPSYLNKTLIVTIL